MKTEVIPLGGVVRSTPDNVSKPGDLSVAMNAANDGHGLEPIELPSELFALESGEKLLAVHKGDGYEHFILLNGTSLKYHNGTTRSAGIATISGTLESIAVIGNTIAYSDGGGMKYLLWDKDSGAYQDLGELPPPPKFRFGLQAELACYPAAGVESGKIEMLEAPFEAMTEEEQKQFTPGLGANMSDTPHTDGGDWSSVGYGKHHDVHHPTRDNNLWMLDADDNEVVRTSYNLDLEKAYRAGTYPKVLESVDKMSDYALGHVMGLVDEAHKDGKFVMPFFVRVCYEMYDGSHIMHSYPVLMVPNSDTPQFLLDQKHNANNTSANGGFNVGTNLNAPYDKGMWTVHGRAYSWAARLVSRCVMSQAERTTLGKWKDIIPRVVIGVSRPFYTYLQDGKVYGWKQLVNTADGSTIDTDDYFKTWGCVRRNECDESDYSNYKERTISAAMQVTKTDGGVTSFAEGAAGYEGYCILDDGSYVLDHGAFYALRIPKKPRAELYDEMKSNGTFYRLDFIRTEDLSANPSADYEKTYTEKDKLNTITSAPQLDAYDGSLDAAKAGAALTYNRRLLIGDVSTKSHGMLPVETQHAMDGVTYANAAISGTSVQLRQAVSVGEKMYEGAMTYYANHLPRWIWYPDTKATSVKVQLGSTLYTLPMEIHSPLLGAYHFAGLDDISETGTTGSIGTASTPGWVRESSSYKFSRVANPFVFPAGWGGEVSNSGIKAFAAATKAISEGQFGQYPVFAFCGDGVWSLAVDANGNFTTPAPVQRDILLDGTRPISIDDSVIFVTARGVVGLRGGSAKVLSLPLDGERWACPSISRELAAVLGSDPGTAVAAAISYAAGCKPSDAAVLMYDYAHSRIYVTPTHGTPSMSWVLNLKTGAWTQSQTVVTASVETWPGTFVCGGKVCRMGEIRADKMAIVTRPLVLHGGQLQRLRSVLAEGILPGTMGMSVYGTRDWRNSALMGSVRGGKMREVGGSPWRGHSVVLVTQGDGVVTTLAVQHEGLMNNEIR